MNRKPRTRKVLQDSDSEQEEAVDGMAEGLVLSESSGEGTNGGEGEQPKKSREKKITRIAMANDESEPEEDEHKGKSKEDTKKRGKSQRRKEKETRRGALVKQLKEKIRTSEVSLLGFSEMLMNIVFAGYHSLCLSLLVFLSPCLSLSLSLFSGVTFA